ncbi:uncharacterized protein LOC118753807 [Rhagoletis pomonella]|uniref:uncharacterized protein LOC118753807 n=1 Tax=Rhagoletis pomonella TaxID=28610 RepID=UPI001786FC9F|nr:uncharacterized protein LOC118753807 [Rhagoletis pomonella]
MTPDERYESAKVHRYCINYLATSHVTGACGSHDNCHRCGKAHHTMLHRSVSPPPERRRREEPRGKSSRQGISSTSKAVQKPPKKRKGRTDIQQLAVLTLEKLKQLLNNASAQAGRHVENMTSNLIEF